MTIVGTMDTGELDDIIRRLLEGKGGKQVQLSEAEVKMLCLDARPIFESEPNLLRVRAPVNVCGTNFYLPFPFFFSVFSQYNCLFFVDDDSGLHKGVSSPVSCLMRLINFLTQISSWKKFDLWKILLHGHPYFIARNVFEWSLLWHYHHCHHLYAMNKWGARYVFFVRESWKLDIFLEHIYMIVILPSDKTSR